jgi:luciferase-type oxidoreductase
MAGQIELARQAEQGGFAALWVRDVPLRDPSFGDVGQVYDPWVWLGVVTAQTAEIAVATGAIVLPLRHPIDIAKAAASVDNLSDGRFVLGVASGDRPLEFPAYGKDFHQRGAVFVESLGFARQLLEHQFPRIGSPLGIVQGTDLLPKPRYGRIPIGVTGQSQQTLDWIAANADAWIMYPRPPEQQARVVSEWQAAVERQAPGTRKPFAQSLYIDLTEAPNTPPRPIHLGYRLGRDALLDVLGMLRDIGVNHVIFNLKYGRRPADEVVDQLAREVLPAFPVGRADVYASG